VLGDFVVRQRPESLGEKLTLGDDDGEACPLLDAAGEDDGSAVGEKARDSTVVSEDWSDAMALIDEAAVADALVLAKLALDVALGEADSESSGEVLCIELANAEADIELSADGAALEVPWAETDLGAVPSVGSTENCGDTVSRIDSVSEMLIVCVAVAASLGAASPLGEILDEEVVENAAAELGTCVTVAACEGTGVPLSDRVEDQRGVPDATTEKLADAVADASMVGCVDPRALALVLEEGDSLLDALGVRVGRALRLNVGETLLVAVELRDVVGSGDWDSDLLPRGDAESLFETRALRLSREETVGLPELDGDKDALGEVDVELLIRGDDEALGDAVLDLEGALEALPRCEGSAERLAEADSEMRVDTVSVRVPIITVAKAEPVIEEVSRPDGL
jgi:hypothetical protein